MLRKKNPEFVQIKPKQTKKNGQIPNPDTFNIRCIDPDRAQLGICYYFRARICRAGDKLSILGSCRGNPDYP